MFFPHYHGTVHSHYAKTSLVSAYVLLIALLNWKFNCPQETLTQCLSIEQSPYDFLFKAFQALFLNTLLFLGPIRQEAKVPHTFPILTFPRTAPCT